MQNLQWVRPPTRRLPGNPEYSVVSLVIVLSVYMKKTPTGTYPYVNVRNAISGAPYTGIEVVGPVPHVGQRGLLYHLEGDPNTIVFQGIDEPTTEQYIPLLSWYVTLTTSGTPEGVVGYAFPGNFSTQWAWEVVGAGSGAVILNNQTLSLTGSWTRQRLLLDPIPLTGTLLTPTVIVNSTVSLSLIALVSQSFYTQTPLPQGDH